MASLRPSPSHDAYAHSEAKRRRLRKGTHSCWECKRRKMKCIFDPLATTCNGCLRRGSRCISQEFPEVTSSARSNTFATPSPISGVDSGVRLETGYTGPETNLTNGRAPTTPPSEDDRAGVYGISNPTPVSTTTESSQHLGFYTSSQV